MAPGFHMINHTEKTHPLVAMFTSQSGVVAFTSMGWFTAAGDAVERSYRSVELVTMVSFLRYVQLQLGGSPKAKLNKKIKKAHPWPSTKSTPNAHHSPVQNAAASRAREMQVPTWHSEWPANAWRLPDL